MNLDALKKEWVSHFDAAAHTVRWDSAAERFSKHPIPDLKQDSFLKKMNEKGVLSQENTVLDIGCGTGIFSMAIAPYVKYAVGCDLSPKMLEFADRRCKEEGITNVEFHQIDWHKADLSELRWERRFDVTFAHMTPAISDYHTFDKMARCAKKYCFFQTALRRYNLLLQGACRAIGLVPPGSTMRDEDAIDAFAYFWLNGYEPEVIYEEGRPWVYRHSVEEARAICVEYLCTRKTLAPADLEKLNLYLSSIAEDDIVLETVVRTNVIISCDLTRKKE